MVQLLGIRPNIGVRKTFDLRLGAFVYEKTHNCSEAIGQNRIETYESHQVCSNAQMLSNSVVIFSWKWAIHSLLLPLVIYFCYRVLWNLYKDVFCCFMFLRCCKRLWNVSTWITFVNHITKYITFRLIKLSVCFFTTFKLMDITQEFSHYSIALLKCFSSLGRIKYQPVNHIYLQTIFLEGKTQKQFTASTYKVGYKLVLGTCRRK